MAKNAERLQRILASEESIGVEKENSTLPSINAGLTKRPSRLFGVTEDGSPFVKGEDRAFPPRRPPVRTEIASRETAVETDEPRGSAQRNAQGQRNHEFTVNQSTLSALLRSVIEPVSGWVSSVVNSIRKPTFVAGPSNPPSVVPAPPRRDGTARQTMCEEMHHMKEDKYGEIARAKEKRERDELEEEIAKELQEYLELQGRQKDISLRIALLKSMLDARVAQEMRAKMKENEIDEWRTLHGLSELATMTAVGLLVTKDARD